VAKDGKGREEGRSWLGYRRAEEIVIYSAKVSYLAKDIIQVVVSR
jgi:hypothetical protein